MNREGHVKVKAEIGVMLSQAKGHLRHQKLEEAKRIPASAHRRRCGPADTPIP